MGKVTEQLSPEMVDYIQGKTLVLLQAIEPTSKSIYTSALSWVYAIDEQTIRFAIDSKSDFLTIIDADPSVILTFVGLESVYAVTGAATVKVRQAEGVSIKLAIVEVKVKEVRDIIFYGGKIVQDPQFVKTYKEELVIKLDNEVSAAVKQA